MNGAFMSSTSLQPMAEDALPQLPHSLPSPPHHRRHIRYATPETSTPPQFILETASNNHRPAPSHHRAPRIMSASPTSSTLGSTSQPQHVEELVPPQEGDGQDHDRMETDEENEGSDGSDSVGEDTPEPEVRDTDIQPSIHSPEEDEIMDTSPDNPPPAEPPPPDSGTPPPVSMSDLHPEAAGESAGHQLVQVHVPSGDLEAIQVAQIIAPAGLGSGDTSEERLRAAERGIAEMGAVRGQMRRAERLSAERARREAAGEDGDADDDSDDSTDEEEHPYWVNLKEDISTPDERELKMIEETGNEVSALDHDYWENLAYEPLDDPEYIPNDAGRITWTVKGVHGTAEKPNREKIMRSPSVLMGGYYWNIKYFPHGNDGTEQLSIYIECSPKPREEVEVGSEETPDAISKVDRNLDAAEASGQNAVDGTNTIERDSTLNNDSEANNTTAPVDNMEATPTLSKKSEAKTQDPWAVAAQISCVVYNPEEPRVYASQKGCHRYYNESSDWGWTRFHGPWDEIHKRQRFQRQALLRNDTLAFTAYIRTVKDDTKALWWHPPKDKPEWDSEAMTGIRAFGCSAYQSSAIIAALSSWMYLTPIQKLIRNMEIPDPVWEANRRMRPAFEELQDLYDECESPAQPEEREVSLRGLVSILNFFGAHIDSKMDVVKIWETIRRILNFEASGLDNIEAGNGPGQDLFRDVLLLKQPDLLNHADPSSKYPKQPSERSCCSPDFEPLSVQETLDKAFSGHDHAFRVWQSFDGQLQEPSDKPAVLQIELHRQSYTKEARKWRKLTHRVKIDDTINFNDCDYTLYGMIIHSGDLESNEYYSVLRPEGPGTRWIKYAGDNEDRKVTILTSKQAITAHEGTGNVPYGDTAVAYIAIYVRTDEISSVLSTSSKPEKSEEPKSQEISSSAASRHDEMTDNNDGEPDMPVYIYGAECFQGYEGRGMCDPWVAQRDGRHVKELTFPSSTKISKVKEHVAGSLFKDEASKTLEVRLWPMILFMTDVGTRTFPSMLSYSAHSEDTLDEMGQHSGGCRFWMTIAHKAPMASPPTSVAVSLSEADRARDQEARDAAIHAVMLSIQAVDDQAGQLVSPQTGGAAENADTEMTGEGATAQETERQRQRRQQQLLQHMQMAQQQQQHLAAQQAQQRSQEAERNAQQLKEVYFLVKVFDIELQSLRGYGSAVVKSESRILEETKKLLKVDGSEGWDCYLERDIEIGPKDSVEAHETFEGRCGGADGSIIIIAQRRPTAAQIALYEAEGKCTSPIGYFRSLRGHDDPSYLRDHLVSSYFGSEYASWSLRNGVPHGHGTFISLTGDHYSGSYVAGVKSGQGSMTYANGDTYTGEWKAGEPNGQGQMIYATTGNVYTGGFKKRKRHGKGTMVFEVADEEMQLCKICYESEMDALFYDCGHVAACEECARQVDVCPVCRKNVRAVVRIWRT